MAGFAINNTSLTLKEMNQLKYHFKNAGANRINILIIGGSEAGISVA
jgi:hypothetical protein